MSVNAHLSPPIEFDSRERRIRVGEQFIRLSSRAVILLDCLLHQEGRTVSRDELLESIWPNVTVSDESLTQVVAELRRALGSDRRCCLETVPKLGYRLRAGSIAAAAEESRLPVSLSEKEFDLDSFRLVLDSAEWIARGGEGFIEQSEKAARKAIALSPGYYGARAQLAISLCYKWLYQRQETTDFEEALEEAERAIRLRPDRGMGYASQGFVHGATGWFDSARASFETGLSAEPDGKDLLFLGVRTLFAAGEYRSAAALGERAAMLDPEDYWAAYFSARAASAFDKDREVRNTRLCLKRVYARLQIDPNEPRARNILGPLLAALGYRQEARCAMELQPVRYDSLRVYDAIATAQLGDHEETYAVLDALYSDGWHHGEWLAAEPAFLPLRTERPFKERVEALRAA